MIIKNVINVLNKQSIIRLTFFKIIISIFIFLLVLIFIYGQDYCEKQVLEQNYNLLSFVLKTQIQIQAQITNIEELNEAENLTNNEKKLRMISVIQPIIDKDIDYAVNYYDIQLDVIVKNSNTLFNKTGFMIGTKNLSNNDNVISVNIPMYDRGKLVGYVWAYAQNADYISIAFNEMSNIIIITISLLILITLLIRKYMQKIELYLDKFSKTIISNDYEQEQILTKLPELIPVQTQITFFIDDLKTINTELELSKHKINIILEGISDGYYVLDRDWQFVFVDNKTQKLICKDNSELIGESIWRIFPQGIGSLSYNKMQEAMSQNESVHWKDEGFLITEQYYEYHAYPFKEGLTVFFRDISELKRQKQELDRLERLNLIGQLAAGISHEIRNPMTTVKGFLQIFGSKSRYEQDKENIELMISEIDRANAIITDFLSLAKANLDNDKPQNINEIIKKVLPMLQADAYNNNKEVVIDLNEVPDIVINENEIKQLILNLVRNGLEVTPEHESVIICTYLKEAKVVLAIKDQGTGIPLEIQEKIGTPFFTTKETGTGLGLAISMGIAQRHKAVFEYKTGNNGTIFYTIFPA